MEYCTVLGILLSIRNTAQYTEYCAILGVLHTLLHYGSACQIFNVYCNVLHITAIEMPEHVPECDPPVVTCGQRPPQPNLIICRCDITPTPNGQQDRSSDVRMIAMNAVIPR